MKEFMGELRVLLGYPRNIILLLIRFVLAYGFTQPAILKMNNLSETIVWFTQLSIPYPKLVAYLVTGFESAGIILLIMGLFTRYISAVLGIVMLGAIYFVHLPNGFSAANNGMEIPLYYFIFFTFLMAYGAGKYSLDRLFFERGNDDE